MTETQTSEGMAAHLLVRTGDRLYGLPAERVRRVVASMSLWPAAGHAPGLVGLGRFGGEPLAVLSLESLAKGTPSQWSGVSTVIVVRVGSADDLGLVVDEALDVTTVNVGAGESTQEGLLKKVETGDGRTALCVDFGVLEARKEPIDES